MCVFDCEGNGLVPTKFHVLSYQDGDKIVSLTSHYEMKKWLLKQTLLIGHNIVRWDIPQLERVLKIKIKARLIDTLALSWYLEPSRKLHGLEWWGDDLGIEKPSVSDWENEDLEVYVHRCEQDVRINTLLWNKFSSYLVHLYSVRNTEVVDLPIIHYLMFKMDCAREQEKSGWLVDIDLLNSTLEILNTEKDTKEVQLKTVMPQVSKYREKPYPAKPFKKDGTLSVEGAKWQNHLRELGLSPDHKDPIQILDKVEEPNPSSPEQIKSWLFSLGWEPDVFKEVKEDDGSLRYIPQIKKINSYELSDSIIDLINKCPQVSLLEGLSVISHRIGILKGFKENLDENGAVQAQVHGFTNTLRFKHTTVVNLPSVDRPWGKEVRGCLISRKGHLLCGSDMTSLEDLTKRHYMFDYDPDYVKAMSVEGYDPHLYLAVAAGALTEEQSENHKLGIENHKAVRSEYKTVNYGATYGIRENKLSRDLKTTKEKAKKLLDDFWALNWAIKEVAKNTQIKTINSQMWLLNPVSNFWYSLRYEKDIFSTLNQGTGVYCFDRWLKEVLRRRKQLTAQFHDEGVWEIPEGFQNQMTKILRDSIDAVNKSLKLNVTLDIDIHYGHSYADVH